jgi:hypothetical protein
VVRPALAGHLARLGRSFDTLAGQVREAIARSIGQTVAEAVSEAVHAALADPPHQRGARGPALLATRKKK